MTKLYALPIEVAGTEAVGGSTHVDVTDAGREGLVYWCRVTGGTLVDGDFEPHRLLAPQTIHITDSDAFHAWCAAPVEMGGRGRTIDSEGHVEWIERDILVYALNQWLNT